MRNRDGFFRPVLGNAGSVVSIRRSVAVNGDGTAEEMKARTMSGYALSAETMIAGRTFEEERSVNGKGTKTISPR